MDEIYEYVVTSCFRFDNNRDWYYHNIDKWSVESQWKNNKITLKGDKLKCIIKKIPWRPLWDSIHKAGFNLKEFKDNKFIDWVENGDKKISVTGSIAICLQHFSRTFSSKSKYTIVTSKVFQNLMVNIKALLKPQDGSPCWFFSHSEQDIIAEEFPFYIITLPLLFFDEIDVEKGKVKLKEDADILDVLKSYRLRQEIKFLRHSENADGSKIVSIESSCKMVKYNKGLICGCIPIPGKEDKNKKGDEPQTIKTPEVVVTSRNVVEALESLSQVWQDKFAKSVLISAPPGSGKENFSKTIAYGTGRFSKDEDIKKYIICFADFMTEARQEELADRLFGRKSGTSIEGLIEKSAKKVLFLDEVHHPDEKPGIRASLLRTLESDSYEIKGGSNSKDVDDVLFILATSRPFKSTGKTIGLDKIPPIDFWTRMTHVITIRHPFEGIWGESFKNVICHFFMFFWFQRLENYFKIDTETGRNMDPKLSPRINHVLNQRKAYLEELKKQPKLEGLSEKFYDRLIAILREERIEPHQLSIRGFRNIVTRLFSISADYVTRGYKFDIEHLEKNIDPIIYEILEIATLDT